MGIRRSGLFMRGNVVIDSERMLLRIEGRKDRHAIWSG